MPALIPCAPAGVASWTQQTPLDGVVYQLTFDWFQRDGHWRLTVADVQGVAIRSGIVLVLDELLLGTVIDPRRPAGELVVIDTTGARDMGPGFADLGGRFQLVYLTAADLA